MMKGRKPPTNNVIPPDPDESSFVAWEHNAQAQALRVELQNGIFFILPYTHFAFAQFARESDRDTLRISFATHDVHVSGHNLRELGIALQKLTIDWIREAPPRYAALSGKGCAFIECIEVKETSEKEVSQW